MRELIYIGEDLPAAFPAFILPYHERGSDAQFTAEQAEALVASGVATARLPTEEEMASLEQMTLLMDAAVTLLQSYAAAVTAATRV